jgi:hypothetical protein
MKVLKTIIPVALFLVPAVCFGQARPHSQARNQGHASRPTHAYYTSQSPQIQHSAVDPVSLLPMRPYSTADGAARAAIRRTNPVSIWENQEIAGRVVRQQNGTYRATVGPQYGRTVSSSQPGPVPAGTRNAGVWHDHGGPDPRFDSEHFSGANGDQGIARQEHEPIYVGTPSGSIKKYSPRTGRVTSIGRTPL